MRAQPAFGYDAPAVSTIHTHRFANGLQLLAEPIDSARSLALTMLLPAGTAAEPDDQLGIGSIVSEMICRGAGELDAKAHSDALDRLGVQRSTSVRSIHQTVGATMIATKLHEALPLLMDMVLRPRLEASALEPSRDLALQSLDALEDEPQEKAFIELLRRHMPEPLGRSHLGRRRDLEVLDLEQVRRFRRERFVPDGAILGFAGRIDWPQLKDEVESQLADWQGTADEPTARNGPIRGHAFVEAESAQVHIGIAYDAVPETDEKSILQHAAAAILSGGMSGRLFTEVRERRGLCYSVFASYAGQRDRGAVLSYAGTTTPRAQETLDVLVGELRRLGDGIEEDEFRRAIVGMKSRLVMQGESTGARAGAIVSDQYIFGCPRPLEELAAKVDAVKLDDLRQFISANRPGQMTIVTIGPQALESPAES